jgi:hypothetical protein
MSSLDDGLIWVKNKVKKIEKAFSLLNREGFGILESTDLSDNRIDVTNSTEELLTTNKTNSFNGSLENYNSTAQALAQKTASYLGDQSKYSKGRNYNVFINRTVGPDQITATPHTSSCASSAILNGSGLTDADGAGFNTVYPANFTTFLDAKNACKLWAADTGATYFGLTKTANNTKFKCYTGTLNNNAQTSQYSVKQVATVLASSPSANKGGLFYDGTVGVFTHRAATAAVGTTAAVAATSTNIRVKNAIPTGYSPCDKFVGGGINPSSISATLGANCSGLSKPPFETRYVTVNGNSKGDWLQISQIAVYSYDASSGIVENVAPRGTASSGNPGNPGGPYGWGTQPSKAIDGVLSVRQHPNIYLSPTSKGAEYWQLDLKQNYPVFKVVYYNRSDNQTRANGTTLILENADLTKQITKPMYGFAEQSFTIANTDANLSTGIAKHYPVMPTISGYTFNGNNDAPGNAIGGDYTVVTAPRDGTMAPTNCAALCTANEQCRGFVVWIDPISGYPGTQCGLKNNMNTLEIGGTNKDRISYSRS